MDPQSIGGLWAELEAWVRQHAPELSSTLVPPSDDLRLIGRPLPLSIEELFAATGGQTHRGDPIPGLLWGYALMTPERIHAAWSKLEDQTLLPIAENFGGDHYCVDLTPSGFGRVWLLDGESRATQVIAASLRDWLAELLDGITSGRLVYYPDLGIVPPDSFCHHHGEFYGR